MDMAEVLVVDDEPDIRETVRTILESEGYRVRIASNGREALDLMRQGSPPGLVLLDLMMPEMDGYEVLEAMRNDRALASIPVTVVSAVCDRFGPLGTPCLRKPFLLEELLATVEKQVAPD